MNNNKTNVKDGFTDKKLNKEISRELLTNSTEQVQLNSQRQSDTQLTQQIEDCKIINKTREELSKMGYR
ncbi:hypothetical protein [Clostridium estertheticum]|uniref:Uncharacterized protein n=1 Tax=Clostridium estertheticum subsp. estertheticum TaxID=1552 RepID=A0A1J0GIV9_9CLOT|nr:hypothetical protein [Clostridium estertheticum]APC41285.1 hypothetical protein A7L45_14965 [Clostridium estertheticum subsp. estertheticum]MBU3073045.1 hypothetical protein [Clostridium estertheticum]MBU3162918.1 hypothetical protein [Clostridium estertheticum]MBZ9616882.1 hypothetical protein [Clostridium estertheticum subsp. laramiense]WAG72585.1 hypothetical protein LL032_15705 [Clostridium estertheticum]